MRSLTLVMLVVCSATTLWGQQVSYDVSFPNLIHHEAQITLTLSGVDTGHVVELRMSRSSPGRYALHEFAKNVYDIGAVDAQGHSLAVVRPNPYQWNVAGHHGTLRVTYTVYGDRGDGTYAQIDQSHAHLNMPATFMWARGLDDTPIRVRFHLPAGSDWRVATQLFPTDDSLTFRAPGLQYFMDSPTELSGFTLRQWTVTSNGTTYPIRMAIHHLGTEVEADSFAAMAQRVVAQEIAVYGETPVYDVGRYTFIADYLPWASGDGMEHRNSTILTSTSSLERNAMGLIGTVSHEFFHSWNVERIRPKSLEPFDFERANMSGELWFAEGFTQYYTPLFLVRAGLISQTEYAHRLGGGISIVVNSPARRLFSAVEMSMQAPFVDAATAIDPTNQTNTFISYYTWGSVIGLALDLTLRQRFAKTLDGFMRRMWQKYGRLETAYTLTGLEATLGEFTGDPTFASEFFQHYVRGRDVVDYQSLLAQAGMLVRPSNPEAAFLGLVRLAYGSDGATIQSSTQVGSPLYQAGLDRDDVILFVDGHGLRSDTDWQSLMAAHKPGDVVPIEYRARGRIHTARIEFAADPRLEVVTYEEAGRPVTDGMKQLRAAWLGAK